MNMLSPIEAPEGEATVAQRISALSRRQKAALTLIAAIVVVYLVSRFAFTPPAAAAPAPPVVTVANPLKRDVREWDDYVGRFAPSKTVEIRPRVAGEITAVHFKDGEIVRAGQPLFTIDQRPFAAALAEAQANAASARSTLALARNDLARAQRLIGEDAVSAGEVDALKARLQAAQAAVSAAEARVRSRALDMEFTQVRAPIAGRISDRRVDPGNQVAGGEGTSGTVLTIINALDPIYFTFDGSEALFLKMQRQRHPDAATQVDIRLQDEASYRWQGRLDFTDNGLDPRSGTIRGRAILPNPNYFLTPGMFGNMRLANGGVVPGLLVPDSAVQTDQVRKIVLVVDQAGKVSAKPVELGPVVDGLRIIRSGLDAKDRVIIAGLQMAQPGATVTPKLGHFAATPAVQAKTTSNQFAGAATFATP